MLLLLLSSYWQLQYSCDYTYNTAPYFSLLSLLQSEQITILITTVFIAIVVVIILRHADAGNCTKVLSWISSPLPDLLSTVAYCSSPLVTPTSQPPYPHRHHRNILTSSTHKRLVFLVAIVADNNSSSNLHLQ